MLGVLQRFKLVRVGMEVGALVPQALSKDRCDIARQDVLQGQCRVHVWGTQFNPWIAPHSAVAIQQAADLGAERWILHFELSVVVAEEVESQFFEGPPAIHPGTMPRSATTREARQNRKWSGGLEPDGHPGCPSLATARPTDEAMPRAT